MEPVYIYINGYPGIGKYAIAKEPQKLIPNSKIYQNEWLLDPIAPLQRNLLCHQDIQAGVYGIAYSRLLQCPADVRPVTWIFADCRPTNNTDVTAANKYT